MVAPSGDGDLGNPENDSQLEEYSSTASSPFLILAANEYELKDAFTLVNQGEADAYHIVLLADITLMTNTVPITNPMVTSVLINGDNHAIDGNDVARPLNIVEGDVTITNLTLKNGSADEISCGGGFDGQCGGGMHIGPNATVTLTHSAVLSNTVAVSRPGSGIGGGIANYGTLILDSTIIDGNQVTTIYGPSGLGGGISNFGSLTITKSMVLGNTANEGGGIFNNDTLFLSQSTLATNDAGLGGGIMNYGEMNIANSTFSHNSADGEGGGIRNAGPLTMINSTLTGNSSGAAGGALMTFSAATVQNSILANSPSGNDCTGSVSNIEDNSIDTDGSCGNAIQKTSAEVNLGPLQNNGGPTLTHALLSGSVAIDAGDNTICANNPINHIDQRGVVRPQGTTCDTGAFEADSGSVTVQKEASPQDGTDFTFSTNLPLPADFILTWGNGVNGGSGPEVCTDAPNCQAGTYASGPAGTFENPRDVAVDQDGNIYVTDDFNFRVQKFSSNGDFILMWGSGVNGGTGPEICTDPATCQAGVQGVQAGEFKSINSVTVSNAGHVYVSDSSNNRIQKFDTDGNFIRMWGSGVNGGTGPEICTDPAICQAGDYGVLGGEFREPQDVGTDQAGNIYVTELFSYRVQKFDSDGNFIRMWGSGVNGGTGAEICTVPANCQAGGSGPQGGEFLRPYGVVADNDGHIYVADLGNERVQKFDSDGNFIRMWGSGVNGGTGPEICTVATNCQVGSQDVMAGTFSIPFGIAIDGSGNLYVSDAGNRRIQKFDASGNFISMWGSGVNGGNGAENCILPVKCEAGEFGELGGEFHGISGIAADDQDHIYVADSANLRIQKFDVTTKFTLDDELGQPNDDVDYTMTLTGVPFGDYDIEESLPLGWRLTDIDCRDAVVNSSCPYGVTVQVRNPDHQNVFCRFKNELQLANLTVEKETAVEAGRYAV